MRPHLRFEWDEAKRLSNLRRHGIDFAEAARIFEGLTHTVEDNRFEYGEERLLTYGLFRGKVVVIVHTERSGTIRVISIRKAIKNEEIEFFKNIWD